MFYGLNGNYSVQNQPNAKQNRGTLTIEVNVPRFIESLENTRVLSKISEQKVLHVETVGVAFCGGGVFAGVADWHESHGDDVIGELKQLNGFSRVEMYTPASAETKFLRHKHHMGRDDAGIDFDVKCIVVATEENQ